MERLDTYEKLPSGMDKYLSTYGWHFSKKLCNWATSKMKNRQGQHFEPYDKEKVESLLKQFGISLKNDVGYDKVYVCNMARADFYGSSIKDQQSLAQFVADYLDDIDGSPTRAMDEYVGRMIGGGCPIFWEDVI